MITLQSQDIYDEIALLSLETKHLVRFSKKLNPEKSSLAIDGHFSVLNGRTLFLCRHMGKLYFGIDDQIFEIRDNCTTYWEMVNAEENRIVLVCEGIPVFTWVYRRPIIDPPLSVDPTPGVEEEDFDFCLFIHNVLNDQSRRDRIYTR